jgi:hypothetical protein
LKILPWQGRWLAEGQTEGCPAIEGATPLHQPVAGLTPATNFQRFKNPCNTAVNRTLWSAMMTCPLGPIAVRIAPFLPA